MKTELRKMDIKDYKNVIKDMLGFIHKVCVENDIHYFVAYGTLIGTVRHDGFIPWDDDVDIWMLGEDYNRFVEVFTKSTTDYYILSSDNSGNYYNLMTRVCAKSGILKLYGVVNIENLGPFIDIFPLYKAPAEYDDRMALYQSIKDANWDVKYSLPVRYYKTLNLKQKLATCKHVVKRLGKRYFVGTKKLKEERMRIVTQYENTDSNLYYAVFDLSRISDNHTHKVVPL